MTVALVVTITVVALVLALSGLASTVASRRIGLVHLIGAGLLEAVLLVQAVLAVVAVAGGTRPPELATFLAYLVGVLLVPVLGVLWARGDTSRWAGSVLAVAGLVVAIMSWRLLQLWQAVRA